MSHVFPWSPCHRLLKQTDSRGRDAWVPHRAAETMVSNFFVRRVIGFLGSRLRTTPLRLLPHTCSLNILARILPAVAPEGYEIVWGAVHRGNCLWYLHLHLSQNLLPYLYLHGLVGFYQFMHVCLYLHLDLHLHLDLCLSSLSLYLYLYLCVVYIYTLIYTYISARIYILTISIFYLHRYLY